MFDIFPSASKVFPADVFRKNIRIFASAPHGYPRVMRRADP